MARAPEEAEEEEDSQVGEELKTFQSVSARYNFRAMRRPDSLYSMKDFDAVNGLTKQPRSRCVPKSSTLHNQASKNGMQIPTDRTGQQEHFCIRESGQFVKAWSKSMGILAESSGESELAAIIRAFWVILI